MKKLFKIIFFILILLNFSILLSLNTCFGKYKDEIQLNIGNIDINPLTLNVSLAKNGVIGDTQVATFDVYINGELVADDVSSYSNNSLGTGTTWEIRDIKPIRGFWFDVDTSSALSGTLTNNQSKIESIISIKVKTVKVNLIKNFNGYIVDNNEKTAFEDNTTVEQNFTFGIENQSLQETNFSQEGYTLIGFSKDKMATEPEYTINNAISDEWIIENFDNVTLYGIWQVNRYNVTCEDYWVDSSNNLSYKLGENTKQFDYSSTVDTSHWGNEGSKDKYYADMYYNSSSDSIVLEKDSKIYRHFRAYVDINTYNQINELDNTVVSFSVSYNSGKTWLNNQTNESFSNFGGVSYNDKVIIKDITPLQTYYELNYVNNLSLNEDGNYSYTINKVRNTFTKDSIIDIYMKYKKYPINVKTTIDGLSYENGKNGFTFNVYQNGNLVKEKVIDYSDNISYNDVMKFVPNSKTEYDNSSTEEFTVKENKDVIITWNRKKVEVSFYKNTSLTDTTISKETFTWGNSNQSFSNKNWSRTGYNLLGWNETRTATTKQYDILAGVSDSWILSKGPKFNLYAIWSPITYSINYVLNGGSQTNPKTSYNIETATFTLVNPTKTGYTFSGWTGSNGTTKQTSVKIVKGSTGNKSYTANWNGISYKVAFNANGGSGSMSTQTGFVYGTAKTLTANTFSRTGYTFIGWNTKADGTGTSYSNNGNMITGTTASGGTVTLYAQWKINTYKVTFNGNGGTSTSKNVNYNSNIGTLPSSSRKGWSFDGWYTAASGGTKITSNQKITSAVTYYAHWTDNIAPTINNAYVYYDEGGRGMVRWKVEATDEGSGIAGWTVEISGTGYKHGPAYDGRDYFTEVISGDREWDIDVWDNAGNHSYITVVYSALP